MAARRGNAAAKRQALEQLVRVDPGNGAAWERLAVLAVEAGRGEDAGRLRRRKAAIDEARQRYKDLYNDNHFAQDSAELARQAEALGRRFEAIGFLTWLTRHEPFNQDARDALARLSARSPRAACRAQVETFPSSSRPILPGRGPGLRRGPSPRPSSPLLFRDDAAVAWLSFVYRNGESDIHQLPEFAGGGIGLIDYDRDGWLDVFLVRAARSPLVAWPLRQ